MKKSKSKQRKRLTPSIKSQSGKFAIAIWVIALTSAPAIITAAMPAILEFMSR